MQTPVVLILFNRPDTTRSVFERIRLARPERLFVIADGPRSDRPGEADLCDEARRIVVEGIDWPCALQTHFSRTNLGCTQRLTSGLDWAFQEVPEAIVLEDDCVPDPTFFRFASEMLARYRDDERVMMITGQNALQHGSDVASSYYFSRWPLIWGWAGWRRTWDQYSTKYPQEWRTCRDDPWLEQSVGGRYEARCWRAIFDGVAEGQVDDWTFGMYFSALRSGRLTITPTRNLISNIGCGTGGTTTRDPRHPQANRPVDPMQFPLRHPDRVECQSATDRQTFEELFAFLPRRDPHRLWWRAYYRGMKEVHRAGRFIGVGR